MTFFSRDCVKYVQSEDTFSAAMEDLGMLDSFAFDSEGVDLGRDGPLTIISIGGIQEKSPIYVIDVKLIGPDKVFSESKSSLRQLLEGNKSKIAFDCRSDSDALFHQFGVKLSTVQDLQVLDQAVRIFVQGELPPEKCRYLSGGKAPRLPSMEKVAERLFINVSFKASAPHRFDLKVWDKRPLEQSAIEYAGEDVHVIREIYNHAWQRINEKLAFCDNEWTGFWNTLHSAYLENSKRYEGAFRDREKPVRQRYCFGDRDEITEERPIVKETELPSNHPKIKQPLAASKGEQKWEFAMELLRSPDYSTRNKAFNEVFFIVQHDEWYSAEGLLEIRRLADQYPYFTSNQIQKIHSPPKLEIDYYEDYEWCSQSD
jgi:hypothetical protein